VTATASIAVIGAIATPTVAIAGYIFNHMNSKDERVAARELASDAHAHDLEVRRRERAYEDRRAAYRLAIEWALVVCERVRRVDALRGTQDEEPKPDISDEDAKQLQVELFAFGTDEVQAEFAVMHEAAQNFLVKASIVEAITVPEKREERAEKQGQFQAMVGEIKAEHSRDYWRDETFKAADSLAATIKRELAEL
jgi:hypothetical protein